MREEIKKKHALDKVVWSTNDEAEFCRMDKAASRHTARGIDEGTDSGRVQHGEMVSKNERLNILGSDATISLRRVSTVVSRFFQSARSTLL